MFPSLCAWIDLSAIHIPTPVSIAAIGAMGYLVGRRRQAAAAEDASSARRELKRAQAVAQELEKIAQVLRHELASHHGSITRFKERVTGMGATPTDAAWPDICREAEEILRPTMHLATRISQAYDEIRQVTNHLMTFTEVRTDALTGVSNRRALDETLETMFAMYARYELPFSLAIFDIDNFKQVNDTHGHLHGDKALKEVAHAIDDSIRDTDIVARYGGEEFVVVMPNTPLEGACVYAERLRKRIEERLDLTVSGGIATVRDGDEPQSLLSRADAAMYSAKADGRNRVFYHDGHSITCRVPEEVAVEPIAIGHEAG